MNLRDAIAKMTEVERKVELKDPAVKIARVYPYMPRVGRDGLLPDLPCITHGWQLVSYIRRPNDQRELTYLMTIQVFVAQVEVESDVNSDVATALHEALMKAYDEQLKLSDSTALLKSLRSADVAQPARLDFNGHGYVGLHYNADLKISDVGLFGP